MVAFGAAELVVLAMLGGGGQYNDLVSLMDANAYFTSRNIPVTVEKMAELAVTEPGDGKAQVQQLLALRTLADDAAKVKAAKNFKEILESVEAVARGGKANDPQGFAADYARVTAAALGSTSVEKAGHKLPENSARQDALAWFPTNATLVSAIDFRTDGRGGAEHDKAIRDTLAKFMPPEAREMLFGSAEEMGNVRLDRYAFGFAPDAQNPRQSRIYMRVTGKADAKRLVAYIRKMNPRINVQEQKGFRGQKVTVLSGGGFEPAMALVGDTDLLVAGFEGLNPGSTEVLEQMLAVRSGKDTSVLTGPLEEMLKKASPKAAGILVGELPQELRNEFTRGPNAFRVTPKSVIGELLRKKSDLEVRLQANLDGEKDATTFVEDVDRLKKMGLDALKGLQQAGAGLPFPAKTLEPVVKALESLKAEPKGSTVQASLVIPGDGLKDLGTMVGPLFMLGGVKAAPAPPAVIKEKAAPPQKKGDGDEARLVPAARPAPVLTFARAEIACLHEYLDRR